MTYRNRKLLDLAHDMPCMASFAHECQGLSVPCHSNEHLWGRGFSHKAPDWAYAAMCPVAHDYVDGRRGGWAKSSKHAEWLFAYIKTQNYLWENGLIKVNENPLKV